MASPVSCHRQSTAARPGRLAGSLTAVISVLRGLPWFVARRPGTPLRVLCLMAFDTIHVLRNSRRLSSSMLQTLASLLDFGACVNDCFDGGRFSRREYRSTRKLLETDAARVAVNEYIFRLRAIEKGRPSPGGGDRRHGEVRTYREAVVRLSLGTIAATALGDWTIEDGIRAIGRDEDLDILYRIVMLCQIIDDVLDCATDTDNGLPSFLTAHTSPSRALEMTANVAARYVDRTGLPSSPHLFPFRVALTSVGALARATIVFGRWRLASVPTRTGQPAARFSGVVDRHQ